MKSYIKLICVGLLIFSLVLGYGFEAMADYPDKPITVIVMYAPGGGTDMFVRSMQGPLEEALGVSLQIKNVEGGGGAVGFAEALVAEPDGYTVTIPNNALFTLEGLGHIDFGYEDFDMIARVVVEDYGLIVVDDGRWETLDDFIDYARENPGTVRVGHSGVGSSSHIVAERYQEFFDIDLVLVPYDGVAPGVVAARGGHIDAVPYMPAQAWSGIMAGELKVLATPGTERNVMTPEVPTFIEEGYDFVLYQWRGIAAPKGVSEEVFNVWEEAIAEAAKSEKFQEEAEDILGARVAPLFGEELEQFVQETADVFVTLAREIGESF